MVARRWPRLVMGVGDSSVGARALRRGMGLSACVELGVVPRSGSWRRGGRRCGGMVVSQRAAVSSVDIVAGRSGGWDGRGGRGHAGRGGVVHEREPDVGGECAGRCRRWARRRGWTGGEAWAMRSEGRDVEAARRDEAVSGFEAGDAGSLAEAVSGEAEGGASTDEPVRVGRRPRRQRHRRPALQPPGPPDPPWPATPPALTRTTSSAGRSHAPADDCPPRDPTLCREPADSPTNRPTNRSRAAAPAGRPPRPHPPQEADRRVAVGTALGESWWRRRCSLAGGLEDAWAQELLRSPSRSVLAFAAGPAVRHGGWSPRVRPVRSCCGASMSIMKRSPRPWSRSAPWFGSAFSPLRRLLRSRPCSAGTRRGRPRAGAA